MFSWSHSKFLPRFRLIPFLKNDKSAFVWLWHFSIWVLYFLRKLKMFATLYSTIDYIRDMHFFNFFSFPVWMKLYTFIDYWFTCRNISNTVFIYRKTGLFIIISWDYAEKSGVKKNVRSHNANEKILGIFSTTIYLF